MGGTNEAAAVNELLMLSDENLAEESDYLGSLLTDEFYLEEELELQRMEQQEKQLLSCVSGRESVPSNMEGSSLDYDMLKFEADSLKELESMQNEHDAEELLATASRRGTMVEDVVP